MNWLLSKVIPYRLRSKLLRKIPKVNILDKFGEQNEGCTTHGIVKMNTINGLTKAQKRSFFEVGELEKNKPKNILYRFMVSSKDESKPLMNRESLLFILDNDKDVSSALLSH